MQAELFEAQTWERALLRDLAVLMELPASVGVHLAYMVQPYMGRVERGEKTIESRWYKQRRAPFGEVFVGDVIVWKASGGPIRGWSIVVDVVEHTGRPASEVVAEAGPALGVDEGFAATVADRPQVLLVGLGPFHAIDAAHVVVGKRDRRGWVVLRRSEVRGG